MPSGQYVTTPSSSSFLEQLKRTWIPFSPPSLMKLRRSHLWLPVSLIIIIIMRLLTVHSPIYRPAQFVQLTQTSLSLSLTMASSPLLQVLLVVGLAHLSMGSRTLSSLVQPPSNLLTYHHGKLLQGDIPISILWYGTFTPTQKSILSDFLLSLTPTPQTPKPLSPSVTQWWNTIDHLYFTKPTSKPPTRIVLANQLSDATCSMGKTLHRGQITELAAKTGSQKGGIVLVLTADDVAVDGFCMSSCGFHGSVAKTGLTYIWVGNSATQCPGQCAWPFHQPIYGPQSPALVAPNGDVGVDGMVINLASMMAGTVTNPFGNGFYQGPKEAPLEAVTACPGVYGKGAYPGYAGDLLVDPVTSASYNANGVHGRKFLLPGVFDPSTSSCTTLV